MNIGVLKEPSFESRVSLLPEAVSNLTKKGITVLIEHGAGDRSFSNDEDYTKAGAKVSSRQEIISNSDLVLSIQSPSQSEISNLKSKILLGVFQPLFNQP